MQRQGLAVEDDLHIGHGTLPMGMEVIGPLDQEACRAAQLQLLACQVKDFVIHVRLHAEGGQTARIARHWVGRITRVRWAADAPGRAVA
jgi:hypothetical protein